MIEPWKIRAAREALRWSQGQLAERSGATQPYISDLEKEKVDNPSAKTLQAIEAAFQAEGVYFTQDGIQRRTTNSYTIDGSDCYLRLLDDAHRILESGETFLKSAADEKRSSPEVVAKLQSMRRDGIQMRSLIEHGNTFMMGPEDEYRWMDEELFVDGDVKLIYADRVAYLASWANPPRVFVIQDKRIVEEARRNFEYIWRHSSPPEKSTASNRFDD